MGNGTSRVKLFGKPKDSTKGDGSAYMPEPVAASDDDDLLTIMYISRMVGNYFSDPMSLNSLVRSLAPRRSGV